MAVGDKRRRRPSEPSLRPHQYGLRLSDAENDQITRAAGDQKVTAFLVETGLAAAQERRFTREQVADAISAALELVAGGLRPDGHRLSERDTDLLELLQAASTRMLDDPAVTLDTVIAGSCGGADAASVRGWWTGWT